MVIVNPNEDPRTTPEVKPGSRPTPIIKPAGVQDPKVQRPQKYVKVVCDIDACEDCKKYDKKILKVEEWAQIFPMHDHCKCRPIQVTQANMRNMLAGVESKQAVDQILEGRDPEDVL